KIKMLFRMAFAFAGEKERGERIRIDWGALENNSLADKGSATAQARGALSLRRILIDIWGYKPLQAEEIITELAAEQILNVNALQVGTGQQSQPAADPAAPDEQVEGPLPWHSRSRRE